VPSHSHQSLLLWTIRKMSFDGFLVLASEGSIPQGGAWNSLPAPPEMMHLRPDACGFDPMTGHYAFGEAKTSQDIDTEHTRRQLRVFARLVHKWDSTACRLYLAVPRSAITALDRVLVESGLFETRSVTRLHIPDCFIQDTGHEQL
jgi:hypothetical protein